MNSPLMNLRRERGNEPSSETCKSLRRHLVYVSQSLQASRYVRRRFHRLPTLAAPEIPRVRLVITSEEVDLHNVSDCEHSVNLSHLSQIVVPELEVSSLVACGTLGERVRRRMPIGEVLEVHHDSCRSLNAVQIHVSYVQVSSPKGSGSERLRTPLSPSPPHQKLRRHLGVRNLRCQVSESTHVPAA